MNPSSSPRLPSWYYLLFFVLNGISLRVQNTKSCCTFGHRMSHRYACVSLLRRTRAFIAAFLTVIFILFLSILFLFHFPFGVTTFVSHHRCLVPPVYPPALHGSCFLDPTCQLFLPSFFLYFSFPFRSFLSTWRVLLLPLSPGYQNENSWISWSYCAIHKVNLINLTPERFCCFSNIEYF